MLKKSASFVLSRSVSSRSMSTLRGPHSLGPCWTAFLIMLCCVVCERATSNNSFEKGFSADFLDWQRRESSSGVRLSILAFLLRRGPFFVPSTFATFVRTVEVDIITMVRYRRLSAKGSVNASNKAPFPINTQTHRF